MVQRSSACFVADSVGISVDSPRVDKCRATGVTCPVVFEVYVEGADSFCPTTKPITSCKSLGAKTICSWYFSCKSRVSATLEEAGRSESTQGQAEYADYVKGAIINFSFDRPYDPNASYRLSITGVSTHGQAVKVPPIDFEPYRETRMDM
jgi:hypothetical protein